MRDGTTNPRKPSGVSILDERDHGIRLTTSRQGPLRKIFSVVRFMLVIAAGWWIFGLIVAPLEPKLSAEERLAKSRGSIEECIVSTIKGELAFFTRHGYLSYGSYKEIVGACNAISAHIDTLGDSTDPRNALSHAPSIQELFDRHPEFRSHITPYARLTD